MLRIDFVNNQNTYKNIKPQPAYHTPGINKLGLDKDVFVSFGSQKNLGSTTPINRLLNQFDNEINALFPDIDGTIKDFNGKIPESARVALNDVEDNNINIVISTGRTYTEGKDLYKQLGIKPNYMITQQGAEIIDKYGNIIYQKHIDIDAARNIVDSFEEYKLKTNNKAAQIVLYVDGKPYAVNKFKLPHNWEEITLVESFQELLDRGKPPTKILLYEPEGDKDNSKKIYQMIDFMGKKLPDTYTLGHTAKHYSEITNPEATKGNAVKVVLELMNIDIANSASIGDSENDLDMLKTVRQGGGLSICMGNALNSVKNIAEYETEHIDENGFSIAMNNILENNRKIAQHKNKLNESFK